MSRQLFDKLPSSTNAVESYNQIGKSTHRQPLKAAMMATYKKDTAKLTLEIMARRQGLATSYNDQSASAHSLLSATKLCTSETSQK